MTKKNQLSKKLFSLIKSEFRPPLYLNEPYLNNKKSLQILKKCILDNHISGIGPYVKKFEDQLKKITKSKNCISVINGTSAIYLSLFSLGGKPNDEVIMPAFNFIASANACLQLGAIPHFVEIENKTFGIDPNKLDNYLKSISKKKGNIFFNKFTKRPIKFMIITHVYGHICDIHQLLRIAKKYNLKLIEDASEALGSFYKNKHAGTFGEIGVLSFNGNKIVTTGGGGAIICKNTKLSKKIRHISTTAKTRGTYKLIYDEQAFNYRLPNINAALGYVQLKDFNITLKKKRKIFKIYKSCLGKEKEFEIYEEKENRKSNYWLNFLILKNLKKEKINTIIKFFAKNRIEVRPGWTSMTKISFLKKYPRMNCPIAENADKIILNIPSSPQLIK